VEPGSNALPPDAPQTAAPAVETDCMAEDFCPEFRVRDGDFDVLTERDGVYFVFIPECTARRIEMPAYGAHPGMSGR
jgi:hypothetical protein